MEAIGCLFLLAVYAGVGIIFVAALLLAVIASAILS